MKVLWLVPLPIINDSVSHPAPWIIELAKVLVQSGIQLTILSCNLKIEDELIKKELEDIHLIYVKTSKLKIYFITLYHFRIKKMIIQVIS